MHRQTDRPRSRRRPLAALALAGVIALIAAACTPVEADPVGPSPTPEPTQITVGSIGDFTSFNARSEQGDTATNRIVEDFTRESFAYLDDNLAVVGNGGFGEVERLSADPLTVQYTLFDNLTWSDGTPVTLDDLLFGWAVHSGWFDDAAYDQDGNIVSGTRYFDVAASTDGIRDTKRARIDRSEWTLTLVYDEPFADWNREWLVDLPVHTVAERAGVGVDDLVKAIRTAAKGDPMQPVEPNPVLLAAAQAWNTAFDAASTDPAIATANGPYTASTWSADEVVLLKRDGYVGNHEPIADRIVVRTYPDEEALQAALVEGEIDVANIGEATSAEIGRLQAADLTVDPGARPSIVALMFTEGEGALSTAVREALLASIDRDRLVQESVQAVDPDARPAQSFLATSALGETFDEITSASSPPATGADLDSARGLLDGRTPSIRIRYEPTDVLSADMFAEIAGMAERVGISVRPAGDEESADAEIVTLDVDTTLYDAARERTADGQGGLAAVRAVDEMRERTDPEEVAGLAGAVDAALFARLVGVPLVERPGGVAVKADIEGVGYTASDTGLPRNFWTWQPAAAG